MQSIFFKKYAVGACVCFRLKINNAAGQMFMLMKINTPFSYSFDISWEDVCYKV